MAIENKITTFLNKQKWVIPVLFGFMAFCLVSSLVGVELKGLDNVVNQKNTFNIGTELASIFAGFMLTISILPTYKRQSGYIRLFVTLIAMLCFTMTCDLMQALVDGMPNLIWLNKLFVVLVFTNEAATFFFFWMFTTHALKNEGKFMFGLLVTSAIVTLAFILIPIVTIKNPIYFSINAKGVYHRVPTLFYISRIPFAYFIVATIITILTSRESIKKKIIISLFMSIPILGMASGGYKTGVAIQYAAMMMSIILIFAFLFNNREKDLYVTNRELGLATNIQKQMLPSIFPAFPERKEFDVYASMTPAKEVGGDFYDFFLIDDDHLGLVMADVSDKGVPAALFMMASKIMVQNYALMGKSPSEVLRAVNNQICSNNQNEMFVTIWLGILDIRTGVLKASNAGHEKPLITNKDGKFEVYNDKNNFVVGWYKGIKYSEYEIKLEKGTKIFLYTDGVPEATSSTGQFTRERMLETINKYSDKTPVDIVKAMKNELDEFSGHNDQFDDITMLCAEFIGYGLTTYIVDAKHELIESMISPIIKALEENNANGKAVYQMNLALEEIFVNIVNYAYENNNGKIEIAYDLNKDEKLIKIKIKDKGKEFNPLEVKDPDLKAPAKERQIGGLGIYIVKNIVDDIKYQRINNENVLEIIKKF